MSVVNFLPLAVALGLLAPLVLARVHDPIDRALTRGAIRLFGSYVDEFRSEHPRRRDALRAAHVSATYREYGARTLVYATIFAIAGSLLGIYLVWAILLVLAIEPATLRDSLPSVLAFLANLGGLRALSPGELFALILASSLTVGVLTGGATYWLRWWYPSYVADRRAREIEATLPGTVAFIYALSRSGMEFPRVIRIVAANGDTYGPAAAEFRVAVRHVDVFGMDVISALRTMGRRTASDGFGEFTENLVSVLQSGQGLPEFLERQYHEYQEESESQQESILGLLATLAEAYVTVLVAGPLFLITILVVIGFSMGDTLSPLQAIIYVVLPLGNLAFVVYLSMVTDSFNPGRRGRTDESTGVVTSRSTGTDHQASVSAQPTTGGHLPDGGVARADAGTTASRTDQPTGPTAPSPNVERLRVYRRVRAIRRHLASPARTVLERPERLLAITVPLALVAVLWHLPRGLEDGLAAIDDVLVLAGLFVVASFAVVYEIHRFRIERVEAAVPDLLDRLASVNEAGLPVISAIDRVRQSNLGPLDEELDRLWADIEWGADLETALRRFESRVRTRAISRVVTLLTEAMNASGDLATVLRIAARQAAADRRLDRERRQAMLEYMVVVYVSFLVFVFIIAILSAYLLPNLPTDAAAETGGGMTEGTGLAGLGDVDAAAYTTLFYHATVIQGATSGFIAGQLSTGDVRAGAKHAAIMVTVAVLLFTLVL